MNNQNEFVASVVVSLAAVSTGMVAAMLWGGSLPGWLLSLELAMLLAGALVYGLTGAKPSLAPWLRSRPMVGAALVSLGVAVTFIPLQFVIAAFLIGAGTRLTWLSACELEDATSHASEVAIGVPDVYDAKERRQCVRGA